MGAGAGRLGAMRDHAAATWRRPPLRWLTAGVTASLVGANAFTVALAVAAHDRGGAGLVAVAGVVQMAGAAAAAPVLGRVAAGRSWRVVLAAASAVGAATMGACAVTVAAGWSDALVLALAGLASATFAACRPARLALLEWLTSTTSDLAAGNGVMATAEAFSYFAGPALAAAAFATGDHTLALGLPALLSGAAAVAIHRLPGVEPPAERRSRRVRDGFAVLWDEAAAPVALFVAQTFSRGLLNVLVVAAALEVIGSGDSGVGVLHAALGVGGLVGVVVLGAAAPARGLAPRMATAFAVWGAPLTLIGLVPEQGVAVAALAITGFANVAVDVNGFTVLQRAIPGAVAPQAFAAFEALLRAGLGVGSLVAGALYAAIGVRGGLVVAGLVLPAAVAVGRPSLLRLGRTLDDAEGRLEAMRRVPSLAAMSVGALDVIARHAEDVVFPTGARILGAGTAGNEVFVVLDGEAAVVRPNHRRVGTIGPGQIVGEVAALYGVARTASVVAVVDVVALRLDGDAFARAMSYCDEAHAMAEDVLAGYGRWVTTAVAAAQPAERRVKPAKRAARTAAIRAARS